MIDLMNEKKEILKAVPVRRRSAARLAAVQIVYQSLITGQLTLNFFQQYLLHYACDAAKLFRVRGLDEEHLNALFEGVEYDMEAIDSAIAAQLDHGWSLDRLTRIELSVLRCGTHELKSMPQIPARVAVSEYAALSDACGCDVGFVNAVLDRFARTARNAEME